MTFEIELSSQASRFLRRQPQQTAKRILAKLDQVKLNPFRFLEHHEGKVGFKLRIGDYRALCDVDSRQNTIWVRVIDKHGRIYSRRSL